MIVTFYQYFEYLLIFIWYFKISKRFSFFGILLVLAFFAI